MLINMDDIMIWECIKSKLLNEIDDKVVGSEVVDVGVDVSDFTKVDKASSSNRGSLTWGSGTNNDEDKPAWNKGYNISRPIMKW